MFGFVSGLRSVPLKNAYSEDIPLAALLVHLDIRSAKVRSSLRNVCDYKVIIFQRRSEHAGCLPVAYSPY